MTEIVRVVEELGALELPGDAVVIVDEALPAALLAALPEALRVTAGEGLKRLEAVEALAERVLERRATRPLTVVAVGGGSLGDAAGFLASVLWRGVPIWHVPTTLVAMVDSAHGGKTAVNLGSAKNQLGTFHMPERVIIALDALATLPLEQRRDGLAELIKGLWLGDAGALELLEADGGVGALASAPAVEIMPRLRVLLERAIAVKYDVVARDPHETLGLRTWLNFGHTVAHALELRLGLSHGHAVAWGMASASELMRERGDGASGEADRLWGHVWPLLTPLELREVEAAEFEALLTRDKKRVGGVLRSVLLRGAGEPFVTTDVSAAQWFEALHRAHRRLVEQPLRVALTRRREVVLRMEASKSELNRAFVIGALRAGVTRVVGESRAADVVHLSGALRVWRAAGQDEALTVHAGLGGTTLRFLLAAAATRRGATTIFAEPRLLARPHGPLLDALRALGCEVVVGEEAICVRPPAEGAWVGEVEVDVSASSQYASALAMLAAAGRPMRLVLRTGAGVYDEARAVSLSYLRMTLAMVEAAGVRVSWRGEVIELEPTPALGEEAVLVAHPDESSAAVWRCLRALGVGVQIEAPATSLQADRALGAILERLVAAGEGETVVASLRECPDLAPVLAATASLMTPALHICDAEHLRYKESDRIGELIAMLSAAGVEAEARADGVFIRAGVQAPEAGARLPTFGDHRLAMAALVLASAASVVVEAPWVVTKSYPRFWSDAREVGFEVERG
jgi:3-phosphoshikimate 1-carboxyvinyltransferase